MKRNFIIKTVSFFLLIYSVLCYFSVFDSNSHHWLTVSDALGIQFLYDDFIIGQGNLKDWYFPVAPSVFPDVFLYCVTQLFHQNFMISILIYAILFMIMLSITSMYIFEKSVPDYLKEYSWLIPLLFSLVFLESYYFTHDIILAQLLTSAYYHSGPFLNALIIYAVFLNGWNDWIKSIFILVFSFIATFCDLLFVVMLSAPFVFSLFFTMNKLNWKASVRAALMIITGSVGGFLFYKYIKDSGITYFYAPEKIFAYEDILSSWTVFRDHMLFWIQLPGFRQIQMIFTFISIPIIGISILMLRKKIAPNVYFLLVFSFCFSLAVIGAPILNGSYINATTLRYSASVFYFSLIPLAYIIAYVLERKLKREHVQKFIIPIIIITFLLLITIKFQPSGLTKYANYYPERTRKLDSISEIYNLKRGISTQTHSKVLTLFSKKKIEVLAVQNDACIAEIGSNISWYYNEKNFNFIVTNLLNPDVGNKFEIQDTIRFWDEEFKQEITILKVKDFYYPNKTYNPVNR
ncbi:MAG: hypothetical protein IPM51_08200 [Sphingobacteriaceae bacterium]|nr:hypothetical protein [Sphingobacteriaceae bacterium]